MRQTKKSIEMKRCAAALAAAALLLPTSGCGRNQEQDQGEQMPEAYVTQGVEVPSLDQAVGLFDVEYSKQSDSEAGTDTYSYSALKEGGGQAVSDYATILEDDQGFSVITEDGTITDAPDFSSQSGTVVLGKEEGEGEGVLRLDISWEEDSCSVTVSLQSDMQIQQGTQPQPLTMEEAVDLLEGMQAQKLGLSGSTSEYSFYPEEGLVSVDGQMCLEVNAYLTATHQIQGTYLVAQEGGSVYRLNRGSSQVTQLV